MSRSLTEMNEMTTKTGCGGIGGYSTTTPHDERTNLSGTYTLSGNYKGTYDEVNSVWTNTVASDYLHGKYDYIYLEGPIMSTTTTAVKLHSTWTNLPRLTNNWPPKMGYTDADGYFTLVAGDDAMGVRPLSISPEERSGRGLLV